MRRVFLIVLLIQFFSFCGCSNSQIMKINGYEYEIISDSTELQRVSIDDSMCCAIDELFTNFLQVELHTINLI